MHAYHMMLLKKKIRIHAVFLTLILGLISCNYNKKSENNMEKDSTRTELSSTNITEKNRKIIEDFADIFYRKKDVAKAFKKYVSEDYIQHNPNIEDGSDAAVKALTPKFSSPFSIFDIKLILVDGNMAIIHLHGRMDQKSRGGAVADIYRLENGKIVEHWDVCQPVPEKTINPHPMF